MRRIFFLMIFPLAAITVNGPTTIYPIDAMTRGVDIFNLISSFLMVQINNPLAEVLIQTSNLNYRGIPINTINQGLIPYVQSINPATNSTLFIVTFSPTKNRLPAYSVVVPIEEIVEVVLSTNTNNLATTGIAGQQGQAYNTKFVNGIIPLLSIDPTQRATDIAFVVSKLPALATQTQVNYRLAIQTAVSAANPRSFYPPLLYGDGLFSFVQSVVVRNNEFIQINYQNTQTVTGSFIVPSEQVEQIYLYPPTSPP